VGHGEHARGHTAYPSGKKIGICNGCVLPRYQRKIGGIYRIHPFSRMYGVPKLRIIVLIRNIAIISPTIHISKNVANCQGSNNTGCGEITSPKGCLPLYYLCTRKPGRERHLFTDLSAGSAPDWLKTRAGIATCTASDTAKSRSHSGVSGSVINPLNREPRYAAYPIPSEPDRKNHREPDVNKEDRIFRGEEKEKPE